MIVDRVNQYTEETVDSKSFDAGLAYTISSRKTMIDYLLTLQDTIYPKLIKSIQDHDAPWATIVDNLFDARRADLLDWLLETEPTTIRKHMNEPLGRFNWSKADFLFTHWLKTHQFSEQQESTTMEQRWKRNREIWDQLELPPSKRSKSVHDEVEVKNSSYPLLTSPSINFD